MLNLSDEKRERRRTYMREYQRKRRAADPTYDKSVVRQGSPLLKSEKEVLRLAACGYSNQRITEVLFLTPGAVRQYMYRIYKKLSVHNRIEAVNKAVEMQLIEILPEKIGERV